MALHVKPAKVGVGKTTCPPPAADDCQPDHDRPENRHGLGAQIAVGQAPNNQDQRNNRRDCEDRQRGQPRQKMGKSLHLLRIRFRENPDP